jgi:hypothetical protein
MDGVATAETAPMFRSPRHILIPTLVRSRDGWKAKAARRRHQVKLFKLNIRDLHVSRDHWRQRCDRLHEQVRVVAERNQQLQSDRDAAVAAADAAE